ncbi:sulfoxide reductase catalytic subunit YedY [Rhodobium orientis]|uniref:Protein-methionine-sulfoxide reductase catalytic subunit MsrP n=1 Tax=Rhodobium orientis TaxID=34017 RepID=A0A327JYP6_9HYPH|nr:protein-methionine-sulfoxide reductase catalytic subunit MsrP [Rhodobium orientis]MBB4301124.1 sulfoxide reductase catalytic subunit YedY [Rhodobium orientis]MBK5949788.1 mononuclear molybdenum enzyme YedY [Rhodobium orientis]RAI30102.1 mononuclear molybdenum enzyme YedY [Rhodobium orientis]
MLIKRTRSWELPESLVTPEAVFLNRRKFLVSSGLLMATAALGGCEESEEVVGLAGKGKGAGEDPSAARYPVDRNEAFTVERPMTPEKTASSYNNFYEFGSHKSIASAAQALPIRPWEITIDGEVEKPLTFDIDDLLARVPLEERLYRLRCVEAWAMVIPWTGFPLKALVDYAKPTSKAKYLRMETFLDPAVATGQKQSWYPWPYVEGLTMAEATNELAFMVTGAYGKPLLKQYGAPLRLATPWKYGFKSVKSIVRFSFVAERPVSFWEKINPNEYGFWANVNPEVPHPRWSQATERLLPSGEVYPTKIYNGYGDQVAGIYAGLTDQKLFM